MPQEKLDGSADFCDPHVAVGVGERLERGVGVVADREDRRPAPAAADCLRDGDGVAAPAGEDADGLALKRVVLSWKCRNGHGGVRRRRRRDGRGPLRAASRGRRVA